MVNEGESCNRESGTATPTKETDMHSTVKMVDVTPLNLTPPINESNVMAESDRSDVDHDVYVIQEEDVQSVMGVCMSREQTRLMSPTTTTPKTTAELSARGKWSFYDEPGDGDPEEEYPKSLHPLLGNNDRGPALDIREHSPHRATTGLPSPWTAGPKTFEVNDSHKKSNRKSPKVRSRASTGPTNMLSDLNIKRFWASFSFPSISDQQFFKEFSLPKLPSMLSSSKEGEVCEQSSGRTARSNSLFTPSFSWGGFTQNEKARSRDPSPNSPTRKEQIPSQGASISHQSRPTHLRINVSDGPRLQTTNLHELSRASEAEGSMPHLYRAPSDQSVPHSALSKVSSLGDDSRWEHVHGQVNSRMKAIKDTLQDSSIKLPSLPSINFSALRPDFTHKRYVSNSSTQLNGSKQPSNPGSRDSKPIGSREQSPVASSQGTTSQKSPNSTYGALDAALENLTGDVVVLGGYRGSILRSAEPPYRRLWVPFKVGLNVRKVNLEVGLEAEDEENMEKHIFSSGMLTHLGPVDISRRLLKKLRKCKNAMEGRLRVHDYGYDWRLSPHFLSRKFKLFLEDLKCNQPCTPLQERGATIIAHSLGGLITRHVANQAPTLFGGILYGGVPQHCVNILGPIRNGDDVMLSSKVLTAQVNFTLRTSYVLLPESGQCFIDKYTRERYDVDFFHAETWKEYAFSPCIAMPLPALSLPERKGLLGSVSLNPKRLSDTLTPPRTTLTNVADKAAQTLNDATSPETHNMTMQMNASQPLPPQTLSTIPLPLALSYLSRTLAATLAFKRELAFNPLHAAEQENTYPPLAILYGASVPTVKSAKVVGREGIKCADAYDDLVFASGDGVVLAKAAMLPRGYRVVEGGKVRTERGHVGLLGDLEGVGRCLGALQRGRGRGIGLGRVEGG